MSDGYAEKVQQEQSAQDQAMQTGRSFTISVTMHPNGLVELSGPIGNKVLANGLLAAGMQELHRWHLMKELEALSKAQNGQGIAGLLKKMGRG